MQAKTGTTFKGRLWKTVDGEVRLGSALASTFGQSQHSDPKVCTRALWGSCPEASHERHVCWQAWAALGTPAPSPNYAGYSAQGLSHGWAQVLQLIRRAWENMLQTTYQEHGLPRGCSHVRETRREVSGLKQRINILNLFIALRVRLSMCACSGLCQRQKERLCAYMHTPHLCLRHPPVLFSPDKYSMNCNKHPKNSKQLIIHHCLLLWLQARI